ncbi:trypsin-like peptidase domain-containing protein [Dethiosulfovibrio sp. F2B]|uniref:trypsin-like peptidase domain-containing protein n=1 Tax=Dethiosulfovibrio faecalis TaxID=2720018 RepID=UPI001F24D126|nr:trypsin-like peptidase domain-containing protein [Dethiosulfovibrio faecalis]MCF4152411.1 trypsin-like peptidase domain-containing protein [Dethiosulfovibrio faecalis]
MVRVEKLLSKSYFRFTLCLLCCFTVLGGPLHAAEIDILALMEERQRAVSDMLESSILYVLVEDDDSYSMGTAFVVADGVALTNAHVVESAGDILVMSSFQRPVEARLFKREYRGDTGGNDFALLKFAPSPKLTPVTFTNRINRMDRVSAWGFPVLVTQFDQSFDDILEGSLKKAPPMVYTEGTVSALVEKNGERTVIHSAAIAGGNSGGPLVNVRGEVVGINTWGYTEEDEGAFVNASIPTERIVPFLQKSGISPRFSRNSPAMPRASLPQISLPQVSSPRINPSDSDRFSQSELSSLRELARSGDSDAQAALGAIYYDGEDVPQDTGQAVEWLEKAVRGGSPDAKALLGVILIFEESYRDPARGISLLRESSGSDSDGEIFSMLSRILYDGEVFGVPRDEDEAFKWAQKASDKGDSDGTAMLAMLYYFGEGVDENDAKALQLAEKAVKDGNSLGKAIMAWMYYDGVAVEEDLETALALATDAAEDDEPSAQGLLAYMYFYGYGVEEDHAAAEGWARRASDQGNEFGWFVLGSLYMEGAAVEKDLAMAWAYMDLANDRYVSDAEEALEELTQRMSSKDLKRGGEIQNRWFEEWGILRTDP